MDFQGARQAVMSTFRPFPLLANPHVQTLLGSVLPAPPVLAPSHLHVVRLPDGDALALHDHVPRRWRQGDPIAVLAHGLSGSHRSGYMQRVGRGLLAKGVRVGLLDLRGSGAGMSLARKTYNAACSSDVRVVAEAIRQDAPASPLILIGFSLGGNVVLRVAGEAERHPVANLSRVIAVAPPIELERCAELLALPSNRIYDRHFVDCLMRLVRRQRRHFPDLPPIRFPRGLTVRGFDDFYTAPMAGYESALDYYRRGASKPLIPGIQTPTHILCSRDDPFVAVESFENLEAPPHVQVVLSDRGGHLGFLGSDGAGGIRWAERWVVEQATKPLRSD